MNEYSYEEKEFELRFRQKWDERRWEEIRPIKGNAASHQAMATKIKDITALDDTIKEVRYNAKGSTQGFYI